MANAPLSARFTIPALLIANFALALGPLLVRLAKTEGGIGPIAAGFWRLALALPVLWIAALRLERAPIRLGRTEGLVVIAGFAFAADLAAWHIGILHARMANATLFGNITAILFPLYGFLVARSWPSPRQAGALTIACVGVALLLGRSFALSADHLWGDLACILAGVCYTVYLIVLERTRGGMPPITTLFLSVAAGVPVLLLAAILMGEQIWPHAWAPLIALTIGSQIIGQGLILFAIGRASSLVVGLMLLVQPIVSATIGWAAYGERLGITDAIGAAAIIIAVILVRENRAPLPQPQPTLNPVV